jgi:predicted metalloenzyme YecM
MSFLQLIPEFLTGIIAELDGKIMMEREFYYDHVCYRVETELEYQNEHALLRKFSTLLQENIVGGRIIATFQLHEPIFIENQKIDIIELPMPKLGSFYKSGLEHAEIVIGDIDLLEFTKKYPDIIWDLSAVNKTNNADVRIILDNGKSVKFHQMSLQQVIALELATFMRYTC